MNIEQLRLLTNEEQKAYIQAEKEFSSPAWLKLKGWVEEQITGMESRAAYAESWEQNRAIVGAILFAQQILALETIAYAPFEERIQELHNQGESYTYANELNL